MQTQRQKGSGSELAAVVAAAGGRHRTATEFVEAALKAAILEGRLPGGTALRQEELAEAFGVSRMPVREALRQLEAQALIDFVPHKGAVVTEISAEDAADNYAIRRALEPAALALSIPALGPEDFGRARDLIAEMDTDPDPGSLGELNRRFHMALYSRAGRAKLLALTEQQLAAADRYLRFHLAAKGREHLSQDEHRALLAAAEARDVAAAVAVLHAHLDRAAATIAEFFRTRGG
ncbi:GntR family transcriptional regulator [Arenibaculum pallidiluteum]|uniref:GntR family transcriptional regulator n=1 Tax=Arenibaculum pallidiluteum TaxID=2812559 RepID=UPI001A96265E|nr:GntR family transcriptional regulator [Arenibaculum pallidiluteum]